jgi:hypothetical protein
MAIVIGINPPSSGFGSADSSLNLARDQNFSFILHPLTQQTGQARSDLMTLTSSDWCNSVVGELDPTQPHSPQIDFAVWLSIPAVVFPPSFLAKPDFSRTLSSACTTLMGTSSSVWVSVPLLTPYATLASLQLSSCVSNMGYNVVFPALDSELPDLPTLLMTLNRLIGVCLRGITLPTSLFLTNKKGYPTLSKKMQSAIEYCIVRGRDKYRFVIEGEPVHSPSDVATPPPPPATATTTSTSTTSATSRPSRSSATARRPRPTSPTSTTCRRPCSRWPTTSSSRRTRRSRGTP